MSHHNTILSQMLILIPRHEFDSLCQQHDNKRRVGALSRWSQFVAMFTCQVSGLSSLRDIVSSLRDIESTLHTQKQHHYHLAYKKLLSTKLSKSTNKIKVMLYFND